MINITCGVEFQSNRAFLWYHAVGNRGPIPSQNSNGGYKVVESRPHQHRPLHRYPRELWNCLHSSWDPRTSAWKNRPPRPLVALLPLGSFGPSDASVRGIGECQTPKHGIVKWRIGIYYSPIIYARYFRNVCPLPRPPLAQTRIFLNHRTLSFSLFPNVSAVLFDFFVLGLWKIIKDDF